MMTMNTFFSPPCEDNNSTTCTLSQTFDNLEREEFVEVSLEKEQLDGYFDLDEKLEGENYQKFLSPYPHEVEDSLNDIPCQNIDLFYPSFDCVERGKM